MKNNTIVKYLIKSLKEDKENFIQVVKDILTEDYANVCLAGASTFYGASKGIREAIASLIYEKMISLDEFDIEQLTMINKYYLVKSSEMSDADKHMVDDIVQFVCNRILTIMLKDSIYDFLADPVFDDLLISNRHDIGEIMLNQAMNIYNVLDRQIVNGDVDQEDIEFSLYLYFAYMNKVTFTSLDRTVDKLFKKIKKEHGKHIGDQSANFHFGIMYNIVNNAYERYNKLLKDMNTDGYDIDAIIDRGEIVNIIRESDDTKRREEIEQLEVTLKEI